MPLIRIIRIVGVALILLLGACGNGTAEGIPTSTAEEIPTTTLDSTPVSEFTTTSQGSPSTSGTRDDVAVSIESFVERWNQAAVELSRGEWTIAPSLIAIPPVEAPDRTHGFQFTLGQPEQLIVDVTATNEGIYSFSVAVIRVGTSEDLVPDAFRIGVISVIEAEPSTIDRYVADLVEAAMKPVPDFDDTVEMPAGVIAQAFTTDEVHALGIIWPTQ